MKHLILKSTLLALVVLTATSSSCTNSHTQIGDYPIRPVSFTQVQLTDNFWAPRIKRNHEVTIPIAFHQSEITGRIKNFEVAGGLTEGTFCSKYTFDDSDVFKIIEGASYSLQTIPDQKLEAYLDSLIYKISMAQEDDGYLFTNRTILGENAYDQAGPTRWSNLEKGSHELYNVGHMYEAAVAFYEATGKRSLLDVAIKNADLIDKVFGWDALIKTPGHQEIELGLIKLYRATGDEKYLDLSKFFLEARGPGGHKQLQQHLKVLDQKEAVGHAVRAGYMFSAMADVAAITGDSSYIEVVKTIWEDIAHRKTYVTGGIGTQRGNEGFDKPYVLPNHKAYCETCASVAYTFMNHRLFSLTGESKYYDMLEKTLYNALLSGVSLTGDHFFYPNPLESHGDHARSEWFGCACCPSNISRFIPALPGYVYSQTEEDIYVNLFIDNKADIELDGRNVEITQKTNYPWNGQVIITINPDKNKEFNLRIRQPGWTINEAIPGNLYRFANRSESTVSLLLNGEIINPDVENGYLVINRKWKAGDQILYTLPMEVRKVLADPKIDADRGKLAFQRGPIIYCAEWPEATDNQILKLSIGKDTDVKTEYKPDLLNGAQVLQTQLFDGRKNQDITLIPYHLWNNRGPGEMMVWIPILQGCIIASEMANELSTN